MNLRIITCLLILTFLASHQMMGQGGNGPKCKHAYNKTSKYTAIVIPADKIDAEAEKVANIIINAISRLTPPGSLTLLLLADWRTARNAVVNNPATVKAIIKTGIQESVRRLPTPEVRSFAVYDECKDVWSDMDANIVGINNVTVTLEGGGDFAGVGGVLGGSGKVSYSLIEKTMDPVNGKTTNIRCTVKIDIPLSITFEVRPLGKISAGSTITVAMSPQHKQALKAK